MDEKISFWNGRRRAFVGVLMTALLLTIIALLGSCWEEASSLTDFSRKNLPPCREYVFGTDWMGRDMAKRTAAGLSASIRLGILASAAGAGIALILSMAAVLGGRKADRMVSFLTDLVMGIPHLLLLILISYAVGKGTFGVALGISLTHWPSLARLLRTELLQKRNSLYIRISERLGKGRLFIAGRHLLPHLLPQFITGWILMFPHAILHEASVTFLGFGLSPEQPSIGVILSESMGYLMTGKWWLAVFPGAALVIVVLLFQFLGESGCRLLDPGSVHE